jgi:ribonuclease-3
LASLELEGILGYTFRNPALLRQALTHRSILSEAPEGDKARNNEQLEFLGDAILGFIASDFLLERHPDLPEGDLSKLKARFVSAGTLHRVAAGLGLGSHLILGRGEELSGGREKRALLADALEAIIAAIYLDGGLEAARRFVVERILLSPEASSDLDEIQPIDSKSALQEFAQARKLPTPRYVVLRETGPDHRKRFTVEVRLGREFTATGEGESKKSASQAAASAVLRLLTEEFRQNTT